MSARHWHLMADLEDYLDHLERNVAGPRPATVKAQPSEWRPPVDIRETPQEYLLEMELAGVDRDAIDLSVLEGMLTVHGERPLKTPGDGEKHHWIGRRYGHFSRTFALPADVDAPAITASTSNGVLTVHLPRQTAKAAAARRIEVK